ncbi:uncharacterized protein LOC116302479 isoform X1 [Actinia tenebrosa]|uniref:Uncharacterized protein LOC116302479 isoform X1 n=1 Tax=Actinia tenebrosa TaxID=6105 RepID=A0A6P8ILI6_ACTTE|nr:uncharacterized protein LOC116302479 isoform X1 [Actinia tenebrosa]
MGTADEKRYLYFYDLQSRDIPKASFPDGYTLHTWQEGAEKIWLDIVTKAFEPGFLTNWTTETFIQRYFVQPQFRRDGFFLVKYGNNFIATAFAWQDEEVSSQGRLHWLAVLPEHRRKGIAKALCYCVLQYHKHHEKNMVLLKTEVYRDKGIQLYEKIGFTSQASYANSLIRNITEVN